MNIFAEFHARIAAILDRYGKEGRLPPDLDPARFVVEPPRDPAMGDLACNATMVFAREVKATLPNPRQFATELAYALAQAPEVDQAEVAGPGFLNIRLKPGVFTDILREILREARQFNPKEFCVIASAAVVEMLLDEESQHLAALSDFIGKPISLRAEPLGSPEQYDIVLT